MAVVLGMDVGASLSKTGVIFNDWDESFKDYSNKIWSHDGEKRVEDYDPDFSEVENVLDLSFSFGDRKVEGFKKEVGSIVKSIESQRWILGNLAEDMSSTHQALASDTLKVLQEEFYLNVLSVVYSAVIEHGFEDEEDIVLGVLVPPRDYFNDKKDIIYGVLGREITIKNNTTGKEITVTFKDENIQVKPESIVSFIASFFDDDNEMTVAGENYGELLNVSVDLGHSTTDLAIMEEFKPKKNSFKTIDYANSQLQTALANNIQREHDGYEPPAKELIKATYTGKITMGAKKEWVGEELKEANEAFANQLYDNVYGYLKSHGISLQQVGSFMFIGGGSVEIPNVKSIRHFFMEKVNEVSAYTESFTPADYISVDNHVDSEEKELPAVRYSNIQGFVRGLRALKADIEE